MSKNYKHIIQYEKEILELKQKGLTQREIRIYKTSNKRIPSKIQRQTKANIDRNNTIKERQTL